MQAQTITLKEALEIIDSGRKCDLVFITYDHRKKSGGERIEARQAHKHNWISAEDLKKNGAGPEKKALKRDPKHYENSTRNIVMQGDQIRKVHIRLIRKVNGKTVL